MGVEIKRSVRACSIAALERWSHFYPGLSFPEKNQ